MEPGCRWIKNPAAISPVWMEKPERIAALAMLTVLGFLVYTVIQRQVRRFRKNHFFLPDPLNVSSSEKLSTLSWRSGCTC